MIKWIVLAISVSFLGCTSSSPLGDKAPLSVRAPASEASLAFWDRFEKLCLEVSGKNLEGCDPVHGVDHVMATILYHRESSSKTDWIEGMEKLCREFRSKELNKASSSCSRSQGYSKLIAEMKDVSKLYPFAEPLTSNLWSDIENFCSQRNRSQFPKCSRNFGAETVLNSLRYSCEDRRPCAHLASCQAPAPCLKQIGNICRHHLGVQADRCSEKTNVGELLNLLQTKLDAPQTNGEEPKGSETKKPLR